MDVITGPWASHDEAATSLAKRQQPILAIPTSYQGLNDGPQPAIVVAIVLGSVVGFLLVLWVVLGLVSLVAGRGFLFGGSEVEEVVVTERPAGLRYRDRSRVSERESVILKRTGSRRRTSRLVNETHVTTRGGIEAEEVSAPSS